MAPLVRARSAIVTTAPDTATLLGDVEMVALFGKATPPAPVDVIVTAVAPLDILPTFSTWVPAFRVNAAATISRVPLPTTCRVLPLFGRLTVEAVARSTSADRTEKLTAPVAFPPDEALRTEAPSVMLTPALM